MCILYKFAVVYNNKYTPFIFVVHSVVIIVGVQAVKKQIPNDAMMQ